MEEAEFQIRLRAALNDPPRMAPQVILWKHPEGHWVTFSSYRTNPPEVMAAIEALKAVLMRYAP